MGRSVTYVLTGVLGNRTMSTKLAESADRCLGTPGRRVWFDAESYQRFPAPRLLQRGLSAFESEVVARRMLEREQLDEALLVNGYNLALALRPRRRRMVVAIDTTPRLVIAATGRRTGAAGIVRQLFAFVNDRRFRALARQVDAWLPISETSKESLVAHYGVDPGRCFVTRSPQPTIDPAAVRHALSKPYRLLFVGNDFARKGGALMLEVFRRGLLPSCELTVISNDRMLTDVSVPSVRVVRGISDPSGVARHYRESDLLVLPTLADIYPNVLCEALAFGLPFAATRVGAIGELIDQSGAGISLPQGVTPEALATTVLAGLSDESRHITRSRAAIEFAQNHLTMEGLDRQMRQALGHVATMDNPAAGRS